MQYFVRSFWHWPFVMRALVMKENVMLLFIASLSPRYLKKVLSFAFFFVTSTCLYVYIPPPPPPPWKMPQQEPMTKSNNKTVPPNTSTRKWHVLPNTSAQMSGVYRGWINIFDSSLHKHTFMLVHTMSYLHLCPQTCMRTAHLQLPNHFCRPACCC